MGIRDLNKFIKENAAESTCPYHLSDLCGKKIAIDISIYMYKFTNHGLIEHIYLMLSLFRHYDITPVFIFDGKPPPEKQELLKKRRIEKCDAKKEYDQLQDLLQRGESADTPEIHRHMEILKNKFISVRRSDIENVKNLIRCYGATYYDAPGEADALCAWLVIQQKVWACLSEDMDLFVYGCPRVLRYFSLLNGTFVLYDISTMLMHLGMTQKEFRQACILAGTDYNCNESKNTLYESMQYLKQYLSSHAREKIDFYEWLTHHHPAAMCETLKQIYDMFDLEKQWSVYQNFANIKIMNGAVLSQEITHMLKSDGFIFPMKNDL